MLHKLAPGEGALQSVRFILALVSKASVSVNTFLLVGQA
jgi:hypothetical protein